MADTRVRDYVRPERIDLKNSPELTENWVEKIIADNPSMLGLGDLVLKDRQRKQPRAGRLDLLLQESDTLRRYEVEIQLGSTDPSHIVRTIEYWDIEKRRYPQYDHCAVLIAEDITSRFLNVISLFNGAFPLIAIQMQALKVGDKRTLVFTKVMDEYSRGLIDEDEDAEAEPTDRNYWEQRAAKKTVGLADQILKILHFVDSTLSLKYNKQYIGIEKDGQPCNFVVLRPKKNRINFEIRLPKSEELDAKIDGADLDTLEYNSRWGSYNIRLTQDDITAREDILKELCALAYNRRVNS